MLPSRRTTWPIGENVISMVRYKCVSSTHVTGEISAMHKEPWVDKDNKTAVLESQSGSVGKKSVKCCILYCLAYRALLMMTLSLIVHCI